MASRIAILLGSGKNIGASTVNTFKAAGYKVAYASRNPTDAEDESTLAVSDDFSKPESVSTVFDTVRKTWGEPSVVIYNGEYAFSRAYTKTTTPMSSDATERL